MKIVTGEKWRRGGKLKMLGGGVGPPQETYGDMRNNLKVQEQRDLQWPR